MKLDELIVKGLRDKDISKAQLAKRIGCTSRAIEYWISGKRKMSLENADKLFKALDISICIGKRKNKPLVNSRKEIELLKHKEFIMDRFTKKN